MDSIKFKNKKLCANKHWNALEYSYLGLFKKWDGLTTSLWWRNLPPLSLSHWHNFLSMPLDQFDESPTLDLFFRQLLQLKASFQRIAELPFKGILGQKIHFASNLIFWVGMGWGHLA